MIRIFVRIVTWLFLALALVFGGEKSPERTVADALQIDVSGGAVQTFSNTHGGFHGDGMTFAALEFSDGTMENRLRHDGRWLPLPMDGTARMLAYGVTWESDGESFSVGPIVTDDEGEPLIPNVQTGWYFLLDREPEGFEDGGLQDVLPHIMTNFTLGVYDADARVLYFCAFDS